ncbi:MAG TPA: hypothetical protein VFG57_06085 [Gaiella sp.]|nr:hypothetical protein [Gaiella sp.]
MQDGALEVTQRSARLEAEIRDGRLTGRAIRGKGVSLPFGAIEGQHQLAAGTLAERMCCHELLELVDQLPVAAGGEVGVDPPLEHIEAKVLESRRLGERPLLARELGQRLAAPQRERFAQGRRHLLRVTALPIRGEPAEPKQIEVAGIDPEAIARGSRLDRLLPQRLSKLGNVRLQDLGRRRGRRSTPEVIDQPVARDELVRAEQEHREERSWLRRVERDDATFVDHLDRSEDPELHRSPPRGR